MNVANNLQLPVLSPIPIPTDAALARKLARAAEKAVRLAQWIHDKERHIEGAGLAGRLLGVTQRAAVGPFEALAFPGFSADETCVQCGWCVDHCPVDNIDMTADGVTFREACILCMRCYHFCPQQAIQCTDRTRNVRRFPRYPGPEGKRYSGK